MTDTAYEAAVARCDNPTHDATHRRLTLALVAIGMFMAVLDTTIVNVALPAMRASLAASVSGLAWIVDAYTLSFAALILAGGVAGDRFGAKTIYLAGLALFVAASAACGFAPSTNLLIAARLVQGTGAALFLPSSLAIVRATFHDPHERARAIAVWATIASVAAAVGPVLGGLLVDGFGWRSAFLVNVPTGIAALVGAWVVVRRAERAVARHFDWSGQIASIVALGALCFAAIELPSRGLGSIEVIGALAVTLVASFALVMIERRSAEPMVPVAWFRNRMFVAMNVTGTLAYVGYFGLLFILSLYLHGVLGLDARQTGLTMLPLAASLSAGNVLSAKLHGRLRPQQMMALGLGVAALAVPLIALCFDLRAPRVAAYVAMALFGGGTALSVPPMISTVLDQVEAELAGVASGLLNALRQSGGLLGVAVAGGAATLAAHLSTALWIMTGVTCAAYLTGTLLSVLAVKLRREN